MIEPIGQLPAIHEIGQGAAPAPGAGGDGPFTAVFRSAIDQVRDTAEEKSRLEYALATGQLDNPAQLMIASSMSEMSVSLLVQLRNKALDAYSELTRIGL